MDKTAFEDHVNSILAEQPLAKVSSNFVSSIWREQLGEDAYRYAVENGKRMRKKGNVITLLVGGFVVILIHLFGIGWDYLSRSYAIPVDRWEEEARKKV